MSNKKFIGLFDEETIKMLDDLRDFNGTTNYTVEIKNAIARAHFHLGHAKEGFDFYVSNDGDTFYKINESRK